MASLYWICWQCRKIFGNSGRAMAHQKNTGHIIEAVEIKHCKWIYPKK